MKDNVIKPPSPISLNIKPGTRVFLAGSIEMGNAENWQDRVVNEVNEECINFTFFNPRRDDWDSSWKQEFENAQFSQQVNWELNALDKADVIIMYFDPNTKSPISLLELGLYAQSGKMLVCCPEGFWRKGNVDIVCEKYNIPLYDDLDKLIIDLKNSNDDCK